MNNIVLIISIGILVLPVILYLQSKKKGKTIMALPSDFKKILMEYVPFYQQLNAEDKTEFENRIKLFLTTVRITGVQTNAEDMDKVLIAASAIIPIFQFKGWEYRNIKEVLLYPDSFSHEFEQQGSGRSVLGMVGNGPLSYVMILSQHELRQAFINKTGKTNTAIHEFVHLVDKTDGTIDGIPEYFMDREYIVPWLQLMHSEIRKIREKKSDIDPYGSTNEAEFFAVVSEYFFERPDLLKRKHPHLYDLLEKIFSPPTPQNPVNS